MTVVEIYKLIHTTTNKERLRLDWDTHSEYYITDNELIVGSVVGITNTGWDPFLTTAVADKIYITKIVQTVGGEEGDGERMHRVVAVFEADEQPPHNCIDTKFLGYVRIDGFHSSYDNSIWYVDDAREVTPFETVVIDYK